MSGRPVEEQRMLDYLLGVLPENEVEHFDEMSIADEVFVEKLGALEHDLVDQYVRGELTGEMLTQFKFHYLASPKRREKVMFAQTFLNVLDRTQMGPAYKPAKTSSFHFIRWGSVAAALILAMTSGYLMFENVLLRNQRMALERREEQLELKLNQQRTSTAQTKDELLLVRQKLAEIENQSRPPDKPRDVKLIALNLTPMTRGISAIPRLVIPPNTDFVTVTLDVEPNEYRTYKVELKNSANSKLVWSDETKAASKVQFKLPADLFHPENYVIELSGVSRNETEIVGRYPFVVSSR